MRRCLRLLAAVAAATAALGDAAPATTYTRSTFCDDSLPRLTDQACAPVALPVDASCAPTQVMALHRGCFTCVDRSTCTAASSAAETGQATQVTPEPMQTMDNNVIVATVRPNASVQALTATEADAQGKEVSNAAAMTAGQGASSGVSKWIFAAPVMLGLVAAGVAFRMHAAASKHQKFLRLQVEAIEEINPFCRNMYVHESESFGDLELIEEERPGDVDDEEEDDDCYDDMPGLVVAGNRGSESEEECL